MDMADQTPTGLIDLALADADDGPSCWPASCACRKAAHRAPPARARPAVAPTTACCGSRPATCTGCCGACCLDTALAAHALVGQTHRWLEPVRRAPYRPGSAPAAPHFPTRCAVAGGGDAHCAGRIRALTLRRHAWPASSPMRSVPALPCYFAPPQPQDRRLRRIAAALARSPDDLRSAKRGSHQRSPAAVSPAVGRPKLAWP